MATAGLMPNFDFKPNVAGQFLKSKLEDKKSLMSASGLQPKWDYGPDCGRKFLTFVVPALRGCNLKCSFCLVRQRREITDTCLRPDDFTQFIREAAARSPVFAIAVQGYEPLLTEALPYTQAILSTGRFLGLPTTLVTNGTKLADAINLMTTLAPNKIAISLDAASADIHDAGPAREHFQAAAVHQSSRGIRQPHCRRSR